LDDSYLADNFSKLNWEPGTITLAFSPNNHVDGGDSVLEGIDPYGHLVMQQQVVDGRKKLITQLTDTSPARF